MADASDPIFQNYLQTARSARERRTLLRLLRMCDDILSGKAHRSAVDDGGDMRPLEERRVTPAAVGAYLRLRGSDGPYPLTMANRYSHYIRARTKESRGATIDD